MWFYCVPFQLDDLDVIGRFEVDGELDGRIEAEEAATDEDEWKEGAIGLSIASEAMRRDMKLSETLAEIEDYVLRLVNSLASNDATPLGQPLPLHRKQQRDRILLQLAELMQTQSNDQRIQVATWGNSISPWLISIIVKS